MENNRVDCDPEEINDYFDHLESVLDGSIPAPFVINIDQSGFQEWADKRNLIVVVPADFTQDEIKIPVARTTKRAPILAGIAADGSTITPAVIVPRKTIEMELFENGYTPDKVMLAYQENGFFTTEIFERWAFEVFFPGMQRHRERYNYDGEILLFLDGFGPHSSDEFPNCCTENGVIPLPIPPHSGDQSQMLDLGIFGVQKTRMQIMGYDSELNKQTIQIMKIVDSFTQAATISNVVSAFRSGGIVSTYDEESGFMIPRIERSEARCVRHWVYQGSSPNKTGVSIE